MQIDGLSERLSPFPDANNNGEKYSLRPRSSRRASEEPEGGKTANKSHKKQKTAPLSKYRRKTANARERNRMREINVAFEALRSAIPHIPSAAQAPNASEKLTKITTLRLAMKYIATLSAALSTPEGDPCGSCADLDLMLLESDGESLQLSDSSALASPDFPETSLSPVDFGDPSLLHTDFAEVEDLSEFFVT